MMVLLNPYKRKRKSRSRKGARKSTSRRGSRKATSRRSPRRRRAGCKAWGTRQSRSMRKRYSSRVRSLISALRECKGGGAKARRAASTAATQAYAGYKYKTIGDNPRRRRRRNGSYRHRYGRNNASTWIPAFKNPGLSVGGAFKAFDMKALSGTVPVLSGFIGNQYLTSFLGSFGFVPSFLRSGMGNLALGGLSAGLLAMVSKYVAPSMSSAVLLGGVVEVVTRATRMLILPALGLKTLAGMDDYATMAAVSPGRVNMTALAGMGNWLTPMDVANARPLSGFGDDLDGFGGDLYGVLSGDAEALGDYATTADAAASYGNQLTGMSGDVIDDVNGFDLDTQ